MCRLRSDSNPLFIQARKKLDRFVLVLFLQKAIAFLVALGLLLSPIGKTIFFESASNTVETDSETVLTSFSIVSDTLIRLLWLIPAVFYARRYKRPSLPHRRLGVSLPIYFAALCLVGYLARIPGAILFGTDANLDWGMTLTGLELYLWIFSCTLVAPILEEFVFRDLALRALVPYGKPAYLLISALLFALQHANGSVLFAFSIGLFFAYLFYLTGKLRYTVLLHIGYNSLSVTLTLLSEYASDTLFVTFALLYSVFVFVCGAVALFRCLFLLRKVRRIEHTIAWQPIRNAFSPLLTVFLLCCVVGYIVTAIEQFGGMIV